MLFASPGATLTRPSRCCRALAGSCAGVPPAALIRDLAGCTVAEVAVEVAWIATDSQDLTCPMEAAVDLRIHLALAATPASPATSPPTRCCRRGSTSRLDLAQDLVASLHLACHRQSRRPDLLNSSKTVSRPRNSCACSYSKSRWQSRPATSTRRSSTSPWHLRR